MTRLRAAKKKECHHKICCAHYYTQPSERLIELDKVSSSPTKDWKKRKKKVLAKARWLLNLKLEFTSKTDAPLAIFG